MTTWEQTFALAGGEGLPLFLRIARAIADDVRRGRLKPGAALPSSRGLSGSLGVHRNTVLAAYSELIAEGWVETKRRGGTYVSSSLPDERPRRFARQAVTRAAIPARPGFDLATPLEPAEIVTPLLAGTISLAGGAPDVRLAPAAALARAYRRALRPASARSVLAYGDERGLPRLRRALASMLSPLRGLAADEHSVMVTRGSQMALDLTARALIAPGDVVAVESFGYRPAWNALRAAGARLVPIAVDGDGLRVDELAALVTRERVRAVYVTPHHQFPTTVTLAPGRRLQLLDLARSHRLAIIEDDYDFEFHYDGRPVLPLASADASGQVVYIGTLSKLLAPGLRVGFVVAPPALVERLALLRRAIDRQGDQAVESAVAELIEEGELARHARRARLAYHARRDALIEALAAQPALASGLEIVVPSGGMALWARAAIDVDAWAERAVKELVAITTARRYSFDGRSRPFVRLGYAGHDERELREAARRLAAAWSARR